MLGNLATSHIRRRRPDAATTTLHQAIDLLEQGRGGAGMSVVLAAGRELNPWRSEAAVQDVHDLTGYWVWLRATEREPDGGLDERGRR